MSNVKSGHTKNGSVEMKPETEYETRKDLIDVMLKKAGWDPKDITQVIQEVDTKQSDFNTRSYKTRSETLKTAAEKAYADYLLLDGSGSPLAVVEAKRTTKDPVLGQEQAEEFHVSFATIYRYTPILGIMKIREFHVQNFRSLKNVACENIGGLTVFIGGNSSGKTNLLEALWLFFNEFDPAPQRNVGSVNDYIWFNRRFEDPVQLKMVFEISKDELMKIIPEQVFNLLNLKDSKKLGINRQIVGPVSAASWSTKSVRVNDQILIEDGQFTFKLGEQKAETQTPQPPVPPAELYGRILQSLSQTLKGKFRVVLAARNAVGSPGRLGDRVSFVQPSTIGELTTYGQSLERDHQEKLVRVEQYVKTFPPRHSRPASDRQPSNSEGKEE